MKTTIDHIGDRRKGWRVRWREAGKPRVEYFETKKTAEAGAKSIKKRIGSGKVVPDSHEATLISFIRSHRITATDAIRTLSVACGGPQIQKGVGDAIRAYLSDCEARGTRTKTLDGYRGDLERYAQGMDLDRPVSSLTPEMVADYITAKYSNETSRKTVKGQLAAFFNWAGDQGWCEVDFGKKIKWVKRLEDKRPPEILTVEQLASLFENSKPKYHPTLALAAFAGVRPEGELQRIAWDDIDVDGRRVVVYGETSKTRDTRTLTDLPENLWRWIETWPAMRRKGRVAPCNYTNWRKMIARTRAMAGMSRWPKDALRHSFASYGFHFRGMEWVIENMGHVDDKILFRHYKGATNAAKAKRYFAIRP